MDRIEIKRLEVFAYHGVEEHEKQNGQNFYIDATLYCDIRTPGLSDNLDDTINYAVVCQEIDKYLKNNRYDLIEAAAENTVDYLFKMMPKLRKIDFTIHKPSAPIGLPFGDVSVSISREWHRAYLSIGSNMGEKEAYLNQAIDAFYDNENCRVIQVSNFVETVPYGPVEQDNFLNGCLEIETLYTPRELLDFIHEVELEAGRVREVHWGPRTLDVDIVFYGDEIIYESDLIVPHKEMHKRGFVLVPLNQIGPYLIHPVTGKSVEQMLDELSVDEKESAGINKCSGCSGCCKG